MVVMVSGFDTTISWCPHHASGQCRELHDQVLLKFDPGPSFFLLCPKEKTNVLCILVHRSSNDPHADAVHHLYSSCSLIYVS